MNLQEANQNAMDIMLFPSESMEEVDGIAGIREAMELFLAEPPENENMEMEEEEILGASNSAMIEHIMQECDDFEVKENEKGDLIITFKKQNDGRY